MFPFTALHDGAVSVRTFDANKLSLWRVCWIVHYRKSHHFLLALGQMWTWGFSVDFSLEQDCFVHYKETWFYVQLQHETNLTDNDTILKKILARVWKLCRDAIIKNCSVVRQMDRLFANVIIINQKYMKTASNIWKWLKGQLKFK